jgi:hypothetical protein
MEHAIHIARGRRQGAPVGDVPHRTRQRQGIHPAGVIVRSDQDRDVVASLDQSFTEMAADEACAAGYKDFEDGGLLLWFTSSRTTVRHRNLYHINIDLDQIKTIPAGITRRMLRVKIIYHLKIDEPVKSRLIPLSVIPAEAGIQSFQAVLDPGVRRGDDMKDFLRLHQNCIDEERPSHPALSPKNEGERVG